MARRMTVLNATGDVTIEWDAAHDDQVKAWVEALMAKGVVFFIVRGEDQIRLKDFARAIPERQVVLFGGTVDKMVDGVVRPVGTPATTEIATSGRAKTADEVVANDTIATQRAVGG
jgi:hypothetical protein